MAKHARVLTDEQRQRLERNREVMASLISGKAVATDMASSGDLSLELDRFLINRTTGQTVPYEGPFGMEHLLSLVGRTYPNGQLFCDGHLEGVCGELLMEGRERAVAIRATVGVGAQLRLTVGPASSLVDLLDAVRVFDRQLHLTAREIGQDLELLSQGYNPTVTSPSDIVQVPFARNVLLNAYLSRTGRYARDALRCTAGTALLIPMPHPEPAAMETLRLCVALSPLLAFLTDNSLRLRDADPHDSPRMIGSLVWDQVDEARRMLAPVAFGASSGYLAYERWVEGIRPILFTSDDGVTFSTGTDTGQRVMEERELSVLEAQRLLCSTLSTVRLTGQLELRTADALPLRQAVGYAALVKGLLTTEQGRRETCALLGLDAIDEEQVERAWHDLREQGWEACVYGRKCPHLAHELVGIATRMLADRDERRLLDELGQLWEVNYVPRDTLLRNWDTHRPKTSDEEAVELYGEGAVIPYDELGGDPPAGRTAELPLIRS